MLPKLARASSRALDRDSSLCCISCTSLASVSAAAVATACSSCSSYMQIGILKMRQIGIRREDCSMSLVCSVRHPVLDQVWHSVRQSNRLVHVCLCACWCAGMYVCARPAFKAERHCELKAELWAMRSRLHRGMQKGRCSKLHQQQHVVMLTCSGGDVYPQDSDCVIFRHDLCQACQTEYVSLSHQKDSAAQKLHARWLDKLITLFCSCALSWPS